MDHTKFSEKGPTALTTNPMWWLESSFNVASAVFNNVKLIANNQTQLNNQRHINARLYGNAPLLGMYGATSANPRVVTGNRERITFNIVQSAVDTLTSKIGKNRPKPLFLTNGGDAKLQRRAKKLNQFIEGVYFENEVYRLMTEGFRDAGVFGTCAIHDYDNFGRIGLERVPVHELLVDEFEAMFGNPRNLYRIKTVDRGVLEACYPTHTKIIKLASAIDLKSKASGTADQVTVCEAWHLPSKSGAKDGKHVICIENGVLLEEPWGRMTFPFAFFHWNKRLFGFWGQAIAEQLQGIQLEINKLLWLIQRTMHLGGTAKLWIQQGSKVNPDHITNDVLPIGWYVGAMPQYVTPPLVQPEIYQHLETLKRSGYEQVGISMLSAQSKKPDGLNSGKALREFNDIETDRFMTVGQAYERFSLDIAYNVIQRAKTIYEENKNLSINVPGMRFAKSIKWKDVDIDDDSYVMQCFPVSAFSDDPAARLQDVQEYMQAGLMDERTGKKLLNFPDLQMVETLETAMEERILSYLDKIVDEDEYTTPDQFMDLKLARSLALQYYNLYRDQGLEETKIDKLAQFMADCDKIEKKAVEEAQRLQAEQNPQPMPGMQPMPPGPGELAGAPVLPEQAM